VFALVVRKEKSGVNLDFVAIGPQRTGTTWLYEMLRQHDDLYVPEAVKETMFFDRRYDRGIEWYASYFENSREGQQCGEVAPTYFDAPKVPERLYEVAPNCDIIISLRHPAERAFSLYLHHLKKGRVPRSFEKAVRDKPRIITAGYYATHIPRWRSQFGADRICFLFLEEIKSNPERVLGQICRQLGIEYLDPPEQAGERVNAASMPRFQWLSRAASLLTTVFHASGMHWVVDFGKQIGLKELVYSGGEDNMPALPERLRERLIREYEEDISYVERATEQDLSHWRK
jgi:hypothetical protein